MVDNHLGVTLKGIVYPHLLETVWIVCIQRNLRNESVVLSGIHTGHINTNVVIIRIVELWILVDVQLHSEGMVVRCVILLGLRSGRG